MEGLNKFKVLTVAFVFMFIFAVAAMYTNTKDVSEIKSTKNAKFERNKLNNNTPEPTQIPENSDEINRLNERIDNLNSRIDELSRYSEKYSCKIYGVLKNDSVEKLSASDALIEAKDNNDLVLTCSF